MKDTVLSKMILLTCKNYLVFIKVNSLDNSYYYLENIEHPILMKISLSLILDMKISTLLIVIETVWVDNESSLLQFIAFCLFRYLQVVLISQSGFSQRDIGPLSQPHQSATSHQHQDMLLRYLEGNTLIKHFLNINNQIMNFVFTLVVFLINGKYIPL